MYGDPTFFDDVPRLVRKFRTWRQRRATRRRFVEQQRLRAREHDRGRHEAEVENARAALGGCLFIALLAGLGLVELIRAAHP